MGTRIILISQMLQELCSGLLHYSVCKPISEPTLWPQRTLPLLWAAFLLRANLSLGLDEKLKMDDIKQNWKSENCFSLDFPSNFLFNTLLARRVWLGNVFCSHWTPHVWLWADLSLRKSDSKTELLGLDWTAAGYGQTVLCQGQQTHRAVLWERMQNRTQNRLQPSGTPLIATTSLFHFAVICAFI